MVDQLGRALSDEVNSDGAFVENGVTAPLNVDTLGNLAARILKRDRTLYEGVRAYWFQTGSDLLKAKTLAGHGHFEEWCKSELNYSKSKAEKLMRAAEMIKPWLKSVSITDLPRPTSFYALSAPSVPQVIRDEYIPRLLAREKGVASELKIAIERHRKSVERPERCTARLPASQAALEPHEATSPGCEADNSNRRGIDREQQGVARSAMLTLILARIGDDLPTLLALVAEAGPGSVFSLAVERELQTHLLKMTAQVENGTAVVADEPEAADVETISASVASEGEQLASSALTNIADEVHPIAPIPDVPTVASMPAPVPIASSQKSTGKFGAAVSTTRTVEPFWPEPRPKFTQSRRQS